MQKPVTVAFKNVSKLFGKRRALDQLSFTVPAGKTCALVGANGAGKTTAFSLMGGFLQPSEGAISIGGEETTSSRRPRLGLLPQGADFPEGRTVGSYLRFLARLSGMSPSQSGLEVKRVLQLVHLSARQAQEPAALSHGMRVRVGIAQALLGSPPLILLDEPTAGLDPIATKEIRDIILSLKGKVTMIISSHDLSELEQVCDYLCLIDQGKFVRGGDLQALTQSRARLIISTAQDNSGFIDELRAAFPTIRMDAESSSRLVLSAIPGDGDLISKQVLQWLLSRDIAVRGFERGSLEDVFLQSVPKGRDS